MLDATKVQNYAGKLVDNFRHGFVSHLGEQPILDVGKATESFRWLLNNVGARDVEKSYDKVNRLLTAYFSMDDKWFKENGYSIDCFKNNINKIIAHNPKMVGGKEHWVVTITLTGAPVISHNSTQLPGEFFVPVLYNKWLKLSDNERMQSEKKWREMGCDTSAWVINWRKWEKDWHPY